MKRIVFLTILSLLVIACGEGGYKKIKNGVQIKLQNKSAQGAKIMRVQYYLNDVVRVTVSPEMSFSNDSSLMVCKKNIDNLDITIEKNNDTIVLKSIKLIVKVNSVDGEISFYNPNGKEILKEKEGGGKWFKPIEIDGKHFWSFRQVFESDHDEAFYGLGQHQDNFMNYKGKDVELYQYNTKVSVPFVVSSKKYGILWDNYSLSRFGDMREYAPISVLKLYNQKGDEGGLTAKYISKNDKNKVFIEREEKEINYEFLTDLKKFPGIFPMGNGKVEWIGYISSDTTGEHKFRLYAAGYIKIWLDGKLMADRWRQAWNPTTNYFTLKMEKGIKYPIRIEWDPDGGESYIGLRALKPLPDDEQQKLSIYSEVGKQMDYYFIKGNTIDEVIKGYRIITGKAPIMPVWAYGFWQSRERYKTQDEILSILKDFRDRHISIDNIVLDWFYWPVDKWGSHDFDTSRFPDPVGMVKEIHEKYNAHIMISVWGKFYEGIENYKKLDEKGFLYKDNIFKKRKDWVYPGYQSTFYDALNPEARKMFWEMMKEKLFIKGFDAWWMDASEPDIHSNLPIEERKAFMNPTALGPSAQYFNAYPLCNARGIYEGQRSADPDKRVYILTRSAYAGQQRYAAATWSGDIGARWEELERQIPAGLNFSISGIPYWTTDIGGFAVERRYEKATGETLEEWRELNTRWYQYGAFCPIFRVHGQFPYREIFNIAPENHPAYKAMLYFNKLRYRLMPYIYSLGAMVYFDDYTIMRPLVMDFIDDVNTYNIRTQFLFGPSMMICPITEYKARKRDVYLPADYGWYDLFSGKYYEGGKIITANAPLDYIPIFVKEGSIIPFGPALEYVFQKSDEPFRIYVYTGKNCEFKWYQDEGINYNYEKGICSWIPLKYDNDKGILTIGDRIGKYSNMPDNMKIEIVWISKNDEYGIDKVKVSQIISYKGKEISVSKTK